MATDVEIAYECDADCNSVNKVNHSDLVMTKTEFLRIDCPVAHELILVMQYLFRLSVEMLRGIFPLKDKFTLLCN